MRRGTRILPSCLTLARTPQWDALDEAEKAKYPFERDLKRRMDGIIADCMKKIERNKERLAAADTPLITPADQVQHAMMVSKAQMCGRSQDFNVSVWSS